jgi:hypothetical protein
MNAGGIIIDSAIRKVVGGFLFFLCRSVLGRIFAWCGESGPWRRRFTLPFFFFELTRVLSNAHFFDSHGFDFPFFLHFSL